MPQALLHPWRLFGTIPAARGIQAAADGYSQDPIVRSKGALYAVTCYYTLWCKVVTVRPIF
jgi:hypothetical protein